MQQHDLWHIFDAVASAKVDHEAVRWRERSWTYAQLRERAIRLAGVLHGHGLGLHRERSDLEPWEAGQDLVATYLLNSPEYLEVTLGGYASRTAPFNVNHRYVADELAHVLGDADPGAVVYHARFAERLAEVLPSLARRPLLLLQVDDESGAELLPGALDYEAALAASSPGLAVTGHDPDDLYVLYTGGTTGMPKGVLWRQADIWLAALGGDFLPDADLDEIVAVARRTSTRFLPNAPFMHAAAQWTALRTLFSGGTVVINAVVDRLDPAEVWSTIEAERIDFTMLVGEAFARPLLDELERHPYDTSSLTVLALGGAPTTHETKQRMLELLPHVLVADGAGSTETGGGLRAMASSGRLGDAAVFQASGGAGVLTADLSGVAEPGHDEPGWFAKQGTIPLGYLGDEAKTRASFPVVDGVRWSVPGDRARLLADGAIQLLGREAATINTGGEKVFGEEVEAAILTHPAVADAIVVGRPSDRWGEEVVAIVALRETVEDDELLDAVSARLARYKVPKAILRVDQVVRSPAGKADYAWARRTAQELRGGAPTRPTT